MFKPGECRYIGAILRPTKSPVDGGREGQPQIVVSDWRFSLVRSGGREMESARQIVPLVTHVLKGWNPKVPVSPQDYVDWEGRRLNVELQDPNMENGLVLMLVCVEQQ